jgi:short-subunit dehydrogenase
MKSPRYALVTGASRGIGKTFARTLAARSWNLIIVARTKNRLDELARDLTATFGVDVEAIALDLTASGAAAHLYRQIADKNREVDLLVNNAGHGDRGRFKNVSLEAQVDAIRLNTEALVEMTHQFLPAMIARRNGAIINVSSTAGFQPMPFAAVYAATKAFVTSFSMALAEEVRADGIKVVTLCPGPTRTDSASGVSSRSRFPGGQQPAEEVVEEALQRIDGKGGLVVPRPINKVMAFANRLMPLAVSARIVARAMRPEGEV